MVQPPLTQADKIMLIWLAGMEVRWPEERSSPLSLQRLARTRGKRAMTPTR
jgi:hypothetical protein